MSSDEGRGPAAGAWPSLGMLAALYAVTGATALANQLVWSRFLALTFGGTLVTTSAVVACFLVGLAAGAALFGRVADRSAHPLRLFAALEAPVGLYAIASPSLAIALRRGFAVPSGTTSLLLETALFLVPPAILMGGSFPALLAAAARIGVPAPRASALLYACNTAGAVAGVLGTGFLLLPFLGLSATVRIAGAVNLLAAAAAWVVDRPLPGHPHRVLPPEPRQAGGTRVGIVLVALGLSGFAALLGEIAWTRALSLLLGSSVYAFAIVLAAFLAGIAMGSFTYTRKVSVRGRTVSSPEMLARLAREDVVHYEVRAATAAAIFAILLTVSPRLLIPAIRAGHGSVAPLAFAAFAVAFVCTVYATSALGAAFPAGIAALAGDGGVARAAGRAYAANTVGAVLGALLTSILLIPHLGLPTTLGLGVAVNLAAAVVASGFRPRLTLGAGIGAALAILLMPLWWRSMQGVIVSGIAAYAHKYSGSPDRPAPPGPGARKKRPAPPAAGPSFEGEERLVFARDGVHANVAVYEDRDQVLVLRIDGKADASTALDGDMRTQLLLGHLPALLRGPGAERALVVGLGSGVTASALAQLPLESIDVVEIEPVVAEAARRFFGPANRRVLEDPRLHLVLGDGRRFVELSENRYDILTSEPSNLWMSGVTSLFTVEFFEAAARALKPDGVLCQWMHLYQVSPSDVQTVLRGLVRSFPHARLFADGPDLLVLASRTPLPSARDLRLDPKVAADLARVGIESAEDLAALELGDESLLLRFAGPGRMHTDDAPVLEFTAPLSLARDRSFEILEKLSAAAAELPPKGSGNGGRP